MEAIVTPSLLDRLRLCARLWIEADEKNTLARLGRKVINDGGFFDNLDKRVKGPTTDTLEKFAGYLVHSAHWPDGQVPEEAVQFAHVCGVSAAGVGPSAGKAGDGSPDVVAA